LHHHRTTNSCFSTEQRVKAFNSLLETRRNLSGGPLSCKPPYLSIMSTPVVVQGTAVSNPHQSAPSGSTNGNGSHPEKAETRCNDPIFAFLFYACIGAIVGVAATYGRTALDTSTKNSTVDYEPYVIYGVVIAVISLVGASGGLAIIMCCPETMIKISLIFSVVMAGAWAAIAFATANWGLAVIATIFFLISICYAWAVWSRIPFASVNLVTAITAVKANLGVALYALLISAMAVAWSGTWSLAFAGVFDHTYVCDAANVCTDPNYGYLFLLFLAFFFGHQVFQVRQLTHCVSDDEGRASSHKFPFLVRPVLNSRRCSRNCWHLVVRAGRMRILQFSCQ